MCEEESYWSVSVCTMLLCPLDQTSLTCFDWSPDTTSPPLTPARTLLSQTSHMESNHCFKLKHTENRLDPL